MAASGSLFTPVRRRYDSSKLSSQFDADGKRVEVETREDEEQGVKMGQTVELLLAAGYFRARIKGLSPFDKVVGGMTWCITTCNFDVNVDLLFQENSTIGQKIALTEKIVAVLPRMMCPHRIEPHQIQGLDFIHIFPVIQWLVKRALETRELMGDYIRSFSISQFNKSHMTPEDKAFEDIKEKSCRTVSDVRAAYKPQRRYCCHDASLLREEEIRVHSTLLEYGRQYEISREAKPEEDETIAKKAAETAGLAGQKVTSGEDQAEEEEERRLKMLMSGMSAMGTQEKSDTYKVHTKPRGKLSASAVGSIVGMQSAEIHQIASEYADKQAELGQMEKSERVGGLQHHKRLVASLNKQIQQQKSKLEES